MEKKAGGQSAAIWRVFADTGVFSVEACLEEIRNSRADDKEEPVEKEETLPDNVSKEQKAEMAPAGLEIHTMRIFRRLCMQ